MKPIYKALTGFVLLILWGFSSSAFSAAIIVNTLDDDAITNGNCTLREAIVAANTDSAQDGCDAGSGADMIHLQVRGLIQVTSDLPIINKSVSILGPGPDDLMVSGSSFPGGGWTAAQYRLFRIQGLGSGADNYLLRGFTIEGGKAPIDSTDSSSSFGGGIRVLGISATITLEFMSIENCYAEMSGGGISIGSNHTMNIRWSTLSANFASDNGGGIYLSNGQTNLDIENSTLSFNEALSGAGGGLFIQKSAANNDNHIVNIDQSTFYGNFSYDGGAIFALEQLFVGYTGTIVLDITNSSIVSNTVDPFDPNTLGGGIYLEGDRVTATFENNIIAKNVAGLFGVGSNDIFASITNVPSITSNSFNYLGYSTPPAFPLGTPNVNKDYVFNGGDPGLEAFADYGGPTRTVRPQLNGFVMDQGSCEVLNHDQRGYGILDLQQRLIDWPGINNADDGCDIGAIEYLGGSSEVGPVVDYDRDGIMDESDNCLFDANLDQSDVDADGIGDVCDYIDDRPARYDMNADGKADLLWRNEPTGRNTVWFMDGPDRTALGLPVVGSAAWQVKGFGDTDGDGRSDILWRNITDGRNQIWKMIEGGKQTGSIATISDLSWELVGSDDFDGNGTDDILWRHAVDGRNTIYFMDGFNATSTSITSISNLDWQVAGTGDIDGDDKADIFWRNQSTGQNTVWLMDGANNSSNNLTTIADTNWTVQGIGDLNDDGLDDIVWRDAVTRAVVAWLMQPGLTEDQQNISASSGANFEIELVGDLSGDRKADIVWRDQVIGTNLLWEMDGVIKTPSSIQKVGDTNWRVMP